MTQRTMNERVLGATRLVDQFSCLVGIGSGYVYVAVFAIAIFEVISRYLFGAPTTWAFEVTIAACGIQYCLAGAYTHQKRGHIRITFIYSLLPARIQWFCDIIAETIVFLTLVSIVYGGWLFAESSVSMWETTGSALNSPSPVFMKLAIPIGALLFLLQSGAGFIQKIKRSPGDRAL